jgi:hypothetical protein
MNLKKDTSPYPTSRSLPLLYPPFEVTLDWFNKSLLYLTPQLRETSDTGREMQMHLKSKNLQMLPLQQNSLKSIAASLLYSPIQAMKTCIMDTVTTAEQEDKSYLEVKDKELQSLELS